METDLTKAFFKVQNTDLHFLDKAAVFHSSLGLFLQGKQPNLQTPHPRFLPGPRIDPFGRPLVLSRIKTQWQHG